MAIIYVIDRTKKTLISHMDWPLGGADRIAMSGII